MGGLRDLFKKFRPRRGREGVAPADASGTRWIVAGLGNPGERYAQSRHNMGFRVLDALAGSKGARFDRRRFKGRVAEVCFDHELALLLKPATFYNLSGESVGAGADYFKVPASRLIVVHDDLDLEPGRLRLKRGGGDAGNRGVRSIADALGRQDFVRVRFGIGRPAENEDSKDYVLKPMSADELKSFDAALVRACDAVEAVILQGLEQAMSRYNQRW